MGPPTALLPFLGICLSVILAVWGKEKMVVCYFTNWSQYRKGIGAFKPVDVDPSLCTHLFYAFAKINVTKNTIEPIEWNYDKMLHPGMLHLKANKTELKLILSVGGYNAPKSGWLNASLPNRVDDFAQNVVNYLRVNQFDGIDIDWETPDAATSASYIRLLRTMRSAIDNERLVGNRERLLLITDVAANRNKVAYYSPSQLAKVMDYIVVMAYDFYGDWSSRLGHHSPLFLSNAEPPGSFSSQHQAVEMWQRAGVPLNKLVLGMAAYGRPLLMHSLSLHNPGDPFTKQYPKNAPYTKAPGVYAYYEACNVKYQPGMTEVFMEESRVPYVYGTINNQSVWIGYDNPRSIAEKTVYAVSRGMAGVMLWTLDFDDFRGSVCGQSFKYPLLRTINEVVNRIPRCLTDADCEINGVKGLCVDEFCGCRGGTFISTKRFCSGEKEPPFTAFPSTDGSHAESTAITYSLLISFCFFSVFISKL